jgi:diguanylate cyclase (GGDEF)-like protein
VSVGWTGDDRLVALAEAGRRLAEPRSLDELYPLAAELALEVLAASSASLSRIERDRGLLRVLRNVGELADWEEPAPDDEIYDITSFPLLAATAERARPWLGLLDDPRTGPAHRELLARMGKASSISLPLIVHGTLWGEVGGARRAGLAPFDETDIAAGEAYCGLLSAALARIAERDELLDLAYRDPLTGLGNRRAIDDRLEELLSSPAGPDSVAVVLCDVNGLKRVNDTGGHDAGDRVLREIGSLLTRTASAVERCLAARLGGDEFCLLIEDVSEIELQRLTERLTEEAARLPMAAGLSCGWARTGRPNEDGPSPMEAARALLRLADAAQYRAKRAGREVLAGGSSDEVSQAAPGEVGARIAARAVAGLRDSDTDVVARLDVVASAVAEVVNAAGWCVSLSIDGGPAVIVRNTDVRTITEVDPNRFAPGTSFDVDDYPATMAALRGDVFHATLQVGDRAEQEFLATYGYDEIVGAGEPFDDRHAWLVEVLGDAMSLPLAPHQGLLRSLVVLALADATDAVPGRWLQAGEFDTAAH